MWLVPDQTVDMLDSCRMMQPFILKRYIKQAGQELACNMLSGNGGSIEVQVCMIYEGTMHASAMRPACPI